MLSFSYRKAIPQGWLFCVFIAFSYAVFGLLLLYDDSAEKSVVDDRFRFFTAVVFAGIYIAMFDLHQDSHTAG